MTHLSNLVQNIIAFKSLFFCFIAIPVTIAFAVYQKSQKSRRSIKSAQISFEEQDGSDARRLGLVFPQVVAVVVAQSG